MLVWDEAAGAIVLYGGFDQARVFTDVWKWVAGDYWSEVAFEAGTPAPAPRTAFDLAYDSDQGVSVLFGGNTGMGTFSDGETWTLDLGPAGAGWTDVTAMSFTAPAPRFGHAMAYDPVRLKVVLFGGLLSGSAAQASDTWLFDTETLGWTELPVPGPSARSYAAMAWDGANERVVLFGGFPGGDETWEFDGTAWTELVSPAHPDGRYLGAMAYDAGRGAIVLAGGVGIEGPVDETWEYGTATLSPNGTGCAGGADCLSGFCTSGVCCMVGVCAACELCDGTGTCSAEAAAGLACDDADDLTEGDACTQGLCVGVPVERGGCGCRVVGR